MLEELANIIKQIALLGAVASALILLGTGLNAIIPWGWLTAFFTIVRRLALLFDFWFDTTTLFTIVTLAMSLKISIWLYEATITVVNYFNEK